MAFPLVIVRWIELEYFVLGEKLSQMFDAIIAYIKIEYAAVDISDVLKWFLLCHTWKTIAIMSFPLNRKYNLHKGDANFPR